MKNTIDIQLQNITEASIIPDLSQTLSKDYFNYIYGLLGKNIFRISNQLKTQLY